MIPMWAPPQRQLVPELMDDPALHPGHHAKALRGLARINAISRSSAAVWSKIRPHATPGEPLAILDVATGAGDVLVGVGLLARRDGVPTSLHACDISPTALSEAARRAEGAKLPLERFARDVLQSPLPERAYDIVMCSLFLHHLSRADVLCVLRTMAAAARRAVIISDLRRSRLGLVAAIIGTRILSRSPIVHVDGPRSVRAAFTLAEMRDLAAEAGLLDARVTPCFPFRFLLEWRRP